MKFKELRITNFMSIGKTQSMPLDVGAVVMVEGVNNDAPKAQSNGAGKSVPLDAITWCLWGSTPRGVRGSEVINNVAEKDCVVELDIEEGDTLCTVSRGQNPSYLKMVLNGKAVTGTQAFIQEKVTAHVGMTFDLFCAIMPGSGVQAASFTDSAIKTLLEKILDVDEMKKAYEIANSKKKLLQSELQSVNNEIRTVTSDIQHNKELISEYAEMKDPTEEVTASILKAETEAALLAPGYSEDSLKEAKKSWGEANLAVERIKGSIQDAKFMFEKQTAQHSVNVKAVKAKIAIVESGGCASCGSTFNSKDSTSIVDAYKEEIRQLNILQDQHKATFESVKSDPNIKIALAALQAAKTAYDEQLALREQHQKKGHLEAMVASWRKQLDSQTEKNAKLQSKMEDRQDAVEALTNVLAEHTATSDTLEAELEVIKFWVDAFSPSGIRSYLLESVVPFLNNKADLYSQILSGGEMSVEFDTQSTQKSGKTVDKFEIRATHAHGSDSWKGASKGERARIDLVVALVLGDLAATRSRKSLNFRFLDEPFANIDPIGQECISRLLKQQQEEFGTIFVISHQNEMKDAFNKCITVTKTGGRTTIGELQ